MGLSRRQLFALKLPAPEADHWIRVHRAAMACRFEVTLSGEDGVHLAAARAALAEADRIEALLTVFRDSSELSRVNRRAARERVAVGAELFALLELCRELFHRSEGAFDVTSTPLSRCWGFLRRAGRLPSPGELEAARAAVGMQCIELMTPERSVGFLHPDAELNLGSIGKGYALGRMGALLRDRGVEHALLSAGGSSVLALGGRRGGWSIDVRSRQLGDERLLRLRLRDGALGTSGAGEQFVVVDGKRYGHVLDPRTGWPAEGVLSVSVVTAQPALADALSTAFFVGGLELARRYCASNLETLAFVTPDDGSGRPQVIGSYAGATWEAA